MTQGRLSGGLRSCAYEALMALRRFPPHGRCLAAPAHIAEHLTIEGKKLLSVHEKWNGRCDRRGVKLQHGSIQFIWAMRALRRLHGAGAAG